jgi:hypothetical protein
MQLAPVAEAKHGAGVPSLARRVIGCLPLPDELLTSAFLAQRATRSEGTRLHPCHIRAAASRFSIRQVTRGGEVYFHGQLGAHDGRLFYLVTDALEDFGAEIACHFKARSLACP